MVERYINGTLNKEPMMFRIALEGSREFHHPERNVGPFVNVTDYEALERERASLEQQLRTVQNAAKTIASAQGTELEHLRQNRTYDHKLRAEHESLMERDAQMTDALLAAESRASALAEEVERLREAVQGNWHGVALDGRNEYGSHVLMLPQRSIELEQDEAGNFLKQYAETILSDAEALGFAIGDAVAVTFDLCTDEGFFSHYEYSGISLPLTSLLYGTPQEQDGGADV